MKNTTMLSIAAEELTTARTVLANNDEATSRLSLVRFELSNRMTRAAGMAHVGGPKMGLVKLSVAIFTDPRNADTAEKELRDTIRHELAHIAVGPGHGHDRTWKLTAMLLGDSGDRCHTMAVTVKRRERFDFELSCSCCGHEIGTIRNRTTVTKWAGNRRTRCCRAPIVAKKVARQN